MGGNFDLRTAARNIFPRLGGAFEIRKRNFSYREARDLGDRIQLIDIQPVSGEKSDPEYNIQDDEGIILTSRNHMVTAEGKYDQVTHPATASFARCNRGPLVRQGQEPQARHRVRARRVPGQQAQTGRAVSEHKLHRCR